MNLLNGENTCIILSFLRLGGRFYETFSFFVKPLFSCEVVLLISFYPSPLLEGSHLYLYVKIWNRILSSQDFNIFFPFGGFTKKIIFIISFTIINFLEIYFPFFRELINKRIFSPNSLLISMHYPLCCMPHVQWLVKSKFCWTMKLQFWRPI